jgi:DNA-binding Lrp family transcriptional regulator
VIRTLREAAMKAAFVLVKCELGRIEQVANALMEIEGVSEVHSVTGDHDLLVKLYAPEYDDFGDLIPDRLQKVTGVRETTTMLAFRAFKPSG